MKNFFQNYSKVILITILIVFAIFLYIYLHPSKEALFCNKDLTCSIEKQYLGFINTKYDIGLNKNSRINFKDHIRSTSRPLINNGERISQHIVHVEILNNKGKFIRPFTGYYLAYDGDYEDQSFNLTIYETMQFNNYIKNPKQGFYLELDTEEHLLLIITVLITAFCFVMYYVFNFIERLFKILFKKLITIISKK